MLADFIAHDEGRVLDGPILHRAQAKNFGYTKEEIAAADAHPEGLLVHGMFPDLKAYLARRLGSISVRPLGPEILNRVQRRRLDKTGGACKLCGILWSRRFEEWSTCTVHSPPALIAAGHRFL